ncbi:SDR family NAD(P)-dependent oxidoreductase [Jatrophihabitans sp. DSM 45814]
MAVALITGASSGLGKALAYALTRRHYTLILDARRSQPLLDLASELSLITDATAIAGDVCDRGHRAALQQAVQSQGGLDLLINNASMLGPSPLPDLANLPLESLSEILAVNLIAPLGLIQELLPDLSESAVVVNVSSDASIANYPGWGGYGASKAALDHLTATLAVEMPGRRWYAIDPGDMRTPMHQAAFPDEDISDRAEPETVAPSLLNLIDRRPSSGRYQASDFGREPVATTSAPAESPGGITR